jgi:GR25 family glycosyltransferase involved in LPS biosynthesis
MGCALSHFGLWKHISSLDSGSFLVLEDDAVLVGDFMNKWSSCASMMPLDSDIVFLGGVLPPNKAGLPLVTEPVNSMFAKVAVNAMFGSKRRYFHFCTYSYIITVAGAQKLCSLVAERGLYTSADHMLVNNMDLLNVYFTTPLLAGCIQDNDPIYQNADFNNFNRVDKFDSEIWNNTDCFTAAEVLDVSSTTLEDLTVVYFEPEQQKQCIDSQWLREIFQREFVWTSFTDSVKTGSKVLLYYQHTTSPSIIEGWINRNIDCAIYLLHASDESCKADVSLYNHPAVRSVFRNYWRPDCISDKVLTLPLGYLNGKGGSGKVLVSSQRPVVWSFAGAIDRAGRAEALDLLKGRYSNYKVHLTPTWGTDKNLEAASYLAMLQECKFVPCLDGFFNTESYRFYEALESGALPIVRVDEKRSYENLLTDAPLLTVNSWSDDIVYDWDSKQKNLLFWWCNYKALLSKKVADYLAK